MSKKRYSEVVALAEQFEVTKTKSGHPQLRIPLKIVDCADKSRVGQELVLYQIVMLGSDDSAKWAVEALRALGMANSNILEPEGLGSIRASCTEVYETYDGKSDWKAKFINTLKVKEGLDEGSADALSAALAAAFASEAPVEKSDANKAPSTLPDATDFPPPPADEDGDDFFK